MYRRGQVNSMDITLASIVFVILLVFLMAFWTVSSATQSMINRSRFEYTALGISDVLLKTQGLPSNWSSNSSNVQMLGLASYPNVLNSSKLASFASMPYGTAKSLLGVSSDFYFYVEDMNGSRLYQAGNTSVSGNTAVTVTRFAILNNQKVRVKVIVYG